MLTILLGDYLNFGGELPTEFSAEIWADNNIDITALFVGKYIDREIGFETPELFYIKLCTQAGVSFPRYAQKLAELAQINVIDAEEVEIRDGDYTRDGRNGYGKVTEYSRFSNPYASVPADDSSLMGHDKSADSGQDTYFEQVKNNDLRTRKSGLNSEAAERLYEQIESDKNNIINDFLNEFEKLFLQVIEV